MRQPWGIPMDLSKIGGYINQSMAAKPGNAFYLLMSIPAQPIWPWILKILTDYWLPCGAFTSTLGDLTAEDQEVVYIEV